MDSPRSEIIWRSSPPPPPTPPTPQYCLVIYRPHDFPKSFGGRMPSPPNSCVLNLMIVFSVYFVRLSRSLGAALSVATHWVVEPLCSTNPRPFFAFLSHNHGFCSMGKILCSKGFSFFIQLGSLSLKASISFGKFDVSISASPVSIVFSSLLGGAPLTAPKSTPLLPLVCDFKLRFSIAVF